jgi:BolA protein
MRLKDRLHQKLTDAFQPEVLEVQDLSHLHQGHAGSRPEGETHFKVLLVSRQFAGKTRLERHQMVYALLQEEIAHLHALELILQEPATPLEKKL